MAGLRRSWHCAPGVFRKALDEFRRSGGTISEAGSGGTLSVSTPLGRLEGEYLYDGEELSVVITTKPALLPIEMIWDRLDRICGPPVMTA